MSLMCTCGEKFKTEAVGVFVHFANSLYACDLVKCPKCSKTALDVADRPLAVGSEVDGMMKRIDAKGGVIYGY